VGTVTSYTFVDPAQTQAGGDGGEEATKTGKPGLQTGAAVANGVTFGFAAVGGIFALLV